MVGGGTITIKPNPILNGWVTHKLENTNTKEVIPLLWRSLPTVVKNNTKDHPSLGIDKRTRNPEGIGPRRPAEIDYRTSTWPEPETPALERTNNILLAPRPRGKEQGPTGCCSIDNLYLTLWSHGLQHARHPCPALYPSLLKLTSIESVMPSNHLILCHPLLLLPSIFPQNQCLLLWVGSLHQVAKLLEFLLQHQSFQWSFRIDFL